MNKVVYSSGLRFIALLLIQVLILSNLNIHQIVTPYFYILFVLMLPVHVSMSVALLSAFVMGISIDMFLNGGGVHAASSVFIAFIRPAVFQVLNPPGGGFEDSGGVISIKQYGSIWVLVYSSILVFIHHLLVFFLEVFTFDDFFFTIAKVIASSALTVVLILIYQFLFFSKG